MNRRQFWEYSAALAVTTCTSPLLLSPQAGSPSKSSPASDALNPSGVRVAGIRMIAVAGGKYKVWTKQTGSGPVKVLLLHGGPGFPHDYLEAMESFLPQTGIEMYYYDQLGVGNSDVPDDPALWTLPRYLTEVEEVRRGLGLDHFVLYGHSWGGILAMEYALNYQQHLRSLVISNMTAGIQSYLRRTATLKAQLLSAETLVRFNALEAAKDYENPAYTRIVMEDLYPQMICRLKPWPEPVTRAFRLGNEKIYNQMQGKSEFEVTGNLKDWERWDRLNAIKVCRRSPSVRIMTRWTLPTSVKMAMLMPNATSAICPNGSHMALWDDQAVYFRYLLAFLRSV